jgi:hypothetical protein
MRLYVTEEPTSTPRNLMKISFFAGIAFVAMSLMVEKNVRGAPLFVGAFILSLLGITAAWLKFQSRYGAAVLTGESELVYGRPFHAVVETELTSVPAKPVRIELYGWWNKSVSISVTTEVPPDRMRVVKGGTVHIPFTLDMPPKPDYPLGDIRIAVRTSTWPLGWGATFLL